MSNQMRPSVTNPTIAEIYQKIKDGKLDLSPSFQRRFVWTQSHQEQFIDTILKGFPFPEIYVCQGETDFEKIITKQKVIDGQQRLTTIMNYIDSKFEKNTSVVSNYKDLTEKERKSFLEYQVVVRDLGYIEDDSVKEVFRRINLTKFKLEDVEIHNAIYDGKFIELAKELSQNIDLSKYNVFYDSQIVRMVDIHFFLSVLATLERDGYFSLDSEIEKCVVEFNEEFSNYQIRKDQVMSSFNILEGLNLPDDSMWFRKSNFYTLIVELSKCEEIDTKNLRENLLSFEENVLSNKNNKNNDYGLYYSYMYSGTNNRSSRIKRGEFFNNYIISKY